MNLPSTLIVIPQRTNNLEAYDYNLRGLEAVLTGSPEGFAQARKMYEKAVTLDPGYGDAYAGLGFLDFVFYSWQWTSDPGELDRAAALANKAIALDDTNAGAYIVRGWVAAVEGKRDQAIANSQRAVSLDPNSLWAWYARADINNTLGGKPEETLAYVEKTRRLDPRHPEIGCVLEGGAYSRMGRYAAAVDELNRCEPNNPWRHVSLIFAYSELGREQEARAEAAEVMRVSPRFSLEQMQQRLPVNWQDPGRQHFLAVLRKAGLK